MDVEVEVPLTLDLESLRSTGMQVSYKKPQPVAFATTGRCLEMDVFPTLFLHRSLKIHITRWLALYDDMTSRYHTEAADTSHTRWLAFYLGRIRIAPLRHRLVRGNQTSVTCGVNFFRFVGWPQEGEVPMPEGNDAVPPAADDPAAAAAAASAGGPGEKSNARAVSAGGLSHNLYVSAVRCSIPKAFHMYLSLEDEGVEF